MRLIAVFAETRNSILPPNQLSDGRGFEAMAGELRLRLGVHNLSDGQVTAFRDAYRQMMQISVACPYWVIQFEC